MVEKKIEPTRSNKSVSKACTIPFGPNYELTPEQLLSYAPVQLRSKAWGWGNVKVVSYRNQVLFLQHFTSGNEQNASIIIKEKELIAKCSCGTAKDERLCHHNYNFLKGVLKWDRHYFSNYRRGGAVELASNHEKYFRIKWELDYVRVESQIHGKLYTPVNNLADTFSECVRPYPAVTDTATPIASTGLCYLICLLPHKPMLPVVVPCLGILNKAGTDVKGFHKFLSGTEKESGHLLTPDQRMLNQLCLKLYKLAEGMPGSFIKGQSHDIKKLEQWLSLWRQIYPLLQHQPLVYRYRLWRMRNLKGKPELKQSAKINLPSHLPPISFILEEKQEYYTFQVAFPKPVPKDHIEQRWLFPFFFEVGNSLYFLPSIKDAAIIEWFDKLHGTIIIFKEHFKQFEKDILNDLKADYNIKKVEKK